MRVLGWLGILAGLLGAMAGFLLLILMHFPSETSVLSVALGRWDDWLAVLICFIGGCWLIWRGDTLAGGPIRKRFKAMSGLSRFEQGQRNIGCLAFGVGIGLLALVLFMLGGIVLAEKSLLSGVIMGLWLVPLVLIIRGGWRRFSGRGWLYGERPWF